MSNYVFKLPDIGEGVVEGEVVSWHVSVGDSVKEDAAIVDIMTDKATVTIPSPTDGVVAILNGEIGDMIAVGATLIEFSTDGTDVIVPAPSAAEATPDPDSSPAPQASTVTSAPTAPVPTPKLTPIAKPASAPSQSTATVSRNTPSRVLTSPAIRRRAQESNVDLSLVTGSGPAGRIRHADLDAYLATGGSVSGAAPTNYSSRRTGTSEIKVVGLRRKIAEQMVVSKFSIPHYSYFEEIDITELEALRQFLNSTRSEGQPKLTYLPFMMLTLAKIMPNHQECNATYDEAANTVTQFEAVHLGIATQTNRGLFVPVVKHVEAMDVWSAATEMQRVSSAARNGTANLDDLSGSTFTITSLGRDGGLGATPIINHPEVSILGVHKAREMPVVRNGKIEIRLIMNISSSFDHRIVDGANGAALIQSMKKLLEHPALIFM
ncbi:MAG: 2-oxo acid dehydrogenase subunit E2 [Euryarchaeota archaeon]|jgi:2-oxoisovalerate dehydrogenase E2 component (dihydrolipoyl transacylase)|nr:2-oxo acid dehydrogenase subunit E2 [Euryarchaeota archaeon]MBT3653885.1 2-oxo acid dehydrogenase subunit E2 [Euryarchaeota archaeon]MBT3757289.1 2-oxo acid dehydrogenase subunit E2 [Euryarchaeota archaeon]MBT4050752.1 2-oxo acid dehydrogenase subunit E2 [Euryarchaeota archaeon]MBT4650350.1 2-oxo acid dehydrogenase subunit E2 [Euryarchaeota archaeon]